MAEKIEIIKEIKKDWNLKYRTWLYKNEIWENYPNHVITNITSETKDKFIVIRYELVKRGNIKENTKYKLREIVWHPVNQNSIKGGYKYNSQSYIFHIQRKEGKLSLLSRFKSKDWVEAGLFKSIEDAKQGAVKIIFDYIKPYIYEVDFKS